MNTVTEARPAGSAAAASRPSALGPGAPSKEYLSFRLGGEDYGVDILRVQEIRSYEAPTRIANAPSFVKGVVNLRGLIVPIVDLRLKLGCDAAEYNAFTVVIVMNVFGRVIGAVVDSVSDVVELAAAQIRPAPELQSGIGSNGITGLGCLRSGDAERMLILLDIEVLMGSAELGLGGGAPQ